MVHSATCLRHSKHHPSRSSSSLRCLRSSPSCRRHRSPRIAIGCAALSGPWSADQAVYETWVTQKGGFDITKNNMPFPSNTMNMARLGLNGKYVFKKAPMLSLIGGANSVTSGRNVGQSTTFYGGAFYIIDFNKTKKDIQDEK